MSAGSWPSSACATGPSWSSPPTSPGSSPPAADRSTAAAYIPRCIRTRQLYALVRPGGRRRLWLRSLASDLSTPPHLSGGAVMSTIAVEALTKRYGTITAVDDLTFGLAPGQINGF